MLGLGIILPDDVGVSDFFDGEFAWRMTLGRALREGRSPLWLPDLHGGIPGGVGDPLSALLFTALSPIAAVNLLLVTCLCVAGLGTLALGRRLGMSLWGAALSAVSFAWSGYLVSHLRHLGILLTV